MTNHYFLSPGGTHKMWTRQRGLFLSVNQLTLIDTTFGREKNIYFKKINHSFFFYLILSRYFFLWLFVDSEVMFTPRLWSCWYRWQRESSQMPEDRLEKSLMSGMCTVLILHSVICNWWRKEGGVRWDTQISGSLYPHAQTRIPAHHQTLSQETPRVFWTASHPEHLLKRIVGDKQTNRATLSCIQTCTFLTMWL